MTVVTTDLRSAEIPHQLEIDFESGVTSPPQHPRKKRYQKRQERRRQAEEAERIATARQAWDLFYQELAQAVAAEIASDAEASATAAAAVVAPVRVPPRARRLTQRPRSTHRAVGYSSRNRNSAAEFDREQKGKARACYVQLRDRVVIQLGISPDGAKPGQFTTVVRELRAQLSLYGDAFDRGLLSGGGFHVVNVFGIA